MDVKKNLSKHNRTIEL